LVFVLALLPTPWWVFCFGVAAPACAIADGFERILRDTGANLDTIKCDSRDNVTFGAY
jgi:hypothetical protein